MHLVTAQCRMHLDLALSVVWSPLPRRMARGIAASQDLIWKVAMYCKAMKGLYPIRFGIWNITVQNLPISSFTPLCTYYEAMAPHNVHAYLTNWENLQIVAVHLDHAKQNAENLARQTTTPVARHCSLMKRTRQSFQRLQSYHTMILSLAQHHRTTHSAVGGSENCETTSYCCFECEVIEFDVWTVP